MLSFKIWLEQEKGEEIPTIEVDSEEIPYEDWSQWDTHFDLFAYGDSLIRDLRPLENMTPARARGFIRVFDVPNGTRAGLSLRRTERAEDTVNGAIIHIPSDEVQKLADRVPGYSLGKLVAIHVDPETMRALKRAQEVYFLISPNRVKNKLQPDPDYLRSLLKGVYDISPAFGEEFTDTTYRLPKRGSRLVRITR